MIQIIRRGKINFISYYYQNINIIKLEINSNNNDEYITNYCIERDETKAYKIDYGFYNQFLEFYSNFIKSCIFHVAVPI